MRPRLLAAPVLLRLSELFRINRYGINLRCPDTHESYLAQFTYLPRATDKEPEGEIGRDLYRPPSSCKRETRESDYGN